MIILVLGQVISLFGTHCPLCSAAVSAAGDQFPIPFRVVTACSFLPMVVFSFLGGGIADRVNKRNIMVALDFATSLLMVGLALALEVLPLVPLLIGVLMLLYGISGAYQLLSRPACRCWCRRRDWFRPMRWSIWSAPWLALGPVVGGVLFGAFGVYPIVLVSALCFSPPLSWSVSFGFPTTAVPGRTVCSGP